MKQGKKKISQLTETEKDNLLKTIIRDCIKYGKFDSQSLEQQNAKDSSDAIARVIQTLAEAKLIDCEIENPEFYKADLETALRKAASDSYKGTSIFCNHWEIRNVSSESKTIYFDGKKMADFTDESINTYSSYLVNNFITNYITDIYYEERRKVAFNEQNIDTLNTYLKKSNLFTDMEVSFWENNEALGLGDDDTYRLDKMIGKDCLNDKNLDEIIKYIKKFEEYEYSQISIEIDGINYEIYNNENGKEILNRYLFDKFNLPIEPETKDVENEQDNIELD